MHVFGPVPSRRLGNSLGINNIPPKHCSFSCVYCQLGRTKKMEIERRRYFEPSDLLMEVEQKIKAAEEAAAPIDYLTFVADGEPTLDENLGYLIDGLKGFGKKVAVISNASTIWRADAREELARADWVCLKVDSVREDIWRKIDRPHGSLNMRAIHDGMFEFSRSYKGVLTMQTMLIDGMNDDAVQLEEIAEFVSRLKPEIAYLSIATRPPAEKEIKPPSDDKLNLAYQIFSDKIPKVEYLIDYEGNNFANTGDTAQDLLNIVSVHPMRESAVKEFLEKSGQSWDLMDGLVSEGKISSSEYGGHRYYLRKY